MPYLIVSREKGCRWWQCVGEGLEGFDSPEDAHNFISTRRDQLREANMLHGTSIDFEAIVATPEAASRILERQKPLKDKVDQEEKRSAIAWLAASEHPIRLKVHYPGSRPLQRLEKVAVMLIGKGCGSAGTDMTTGERDVSWCFRSEESTLAECAYRRLVQDGRFACELIDYRRLTV